MGLVAVVVVLAGYLIGTFPTAAVIGRRAGFDPAAGSGNPGASNAFRLGGRRAGARVLVGDVVKGVVPALAGLALQGRELAVAAGAAAVLGHVLPATRGRRGGKGVATAAGLLMVVEPIAAAAGLVAWIAVAAVTRTASVASITMVVVSVAVITAIGRPWWEIATLCVVGALVIVRHRGNLVRLRHGRERTLDTRGHA